LKPQAQKKRLGEKKTPLTRGTRPEPPRPFLKKRSIKKQNWALPEPARFFEKKRGKKQNWATLKEKPCLPFD